MVCPGKSKEIARKEKRTETDGMERSKRTKERTSKKIERNRGWVGRGGEREREATLVPRRMEAQEIAFPR